MIWLLSCEKTGVRDFAKTPHPSPDSTADIKTVLAASPFTLFRQAAKRIGLDSLLPTGSFFTIFAPVDSVLQAAGLNAAAIGSLSPDSLRKIVLYHVVTGAYSPGALTAAVSSVQANSLRQDYILQNSNTLTYGQLLYLKITGSLYINGEAINGPSDTAFKASNGYIYPIRSLLQAPVKTVWSFLKDRPELSMYLAGLRIDDSIYRAHRMGSGYYSSIPDSNIFGRLVYTNQRNPGDGGYQNPYALPTVFAPTNAAFAAAGFNSPADLVRYAASVRPRFDWDVTGNFEILFATPLDSILKRHLVVNANYTYSNLSLYNDLLFNPDINNGGTNGVYPMKVFGSGFALVQPLVRIMNKNNVVNIKWSDSSAITPVLLPADKNRHFMTMNGVVYETDQLFYAR